MIEQLLRLKAAPDFIKNAAISLDNKVALHEIDGPKQEKIRLELRVLVHKAGGDVVAPSLADKVPLDDEELREASHKAKRQTVELLERRRELEESGASIDEYLGLPSRATDAWQECWEPLLGELKAKALEGIFSNPEAALIIIEAKLEASDVVRGKKIAERPAIDVLKERVKALPGAEICFIGAHMIGSLDEAVNLWINAIDDPSLGTKTGAEIEVGEVDS